MAEIGTDRERRQVFYSERERRNKSNTVTEAGETN